MTQANTTDSPPVSDTTKPAKKGFTSLVLGLVIGLVIGLFAGAVLVPVYDQLTSKQGGVLADPKTVGRAEHNPEEMPVRPDERAANKAVTEGAADAASGAAAATGAIGTTGAGEPSKAPTVPPAPAPTPPAAPKN